MNLPDDMQKLWQQEGLRKEDHVMWMRLIQEKRPGWEERVQSEAQAWYLVALCIGSLVVWAAWKARYPWVHVGYALMALTIALITIATCVARRRRPHPMERSLKEHLEALIAGYERYIRFQLRSGWWAILPLSAGLMSVIFGIPGNAAKTGTWILAAILLAGILVGQWLWSKHSLAPILKKRDQDARLLQELVGHEDASR